MNDNVERKLMMLAHLIISWDKVDCNQILPVINEFESLLKQKNYQPKQFGITYLTIPSAYIPKLLKDSGKVLLVDKNKCCIFGDEAPYQIKSVIQAKSTISLLNKLNNQ